ncbi:GIY-YIG nuclease family protein [Vibrio atypicus]|uniref:GIY-YIG nuclease family protein n=1 Tax=Vibrio atypicus TaxID=558271 RepID=UPI003530A809
MPLIWNIAYSLSAHHKSYSFTLLIWSKAMPYVYVLTSKSVKGVCKVGYTRNYPSERAEHISKHDLNIWTVAWSKRFNTTVMAQIVEARAHYALSKFHCPRACNSEFFKVSLQDAKNTICSVYAEYLSLPWARRDTITDVEARERAYFRLFSKNPNYFLDHPTWFWQHKKYTELLEYTRHNKAFKRDSQRLAFSV